MGQTEQGAFKSLIADVLKAEKLKVDVGVFIFLIKLCQMFLLIFKRKSLLTHYTVALRGLTVAQRGNKLGNDLLLIKNTLHLVPVSIADM